MATAKQLVSFDPRVDAYIKKSAVFAQPILNELRARVHGLCPEVLEDIKWGFPHFVYNNSPMCHMAAFKAHCAFGFWRALLIQDPAGLLEENAKEAMGHFGRLDSIKSLPSKSLMKSYIQQAMILNEQGIRVERLRRSSSKDIEVPEDLQKALKNNALARQTFEAFSASHKREYVQWISSAKRVETRTRRIEQAMQMMSEGKSQNWRYEKKK